MERRNQTIELDKIYLGDSYELMKSIPDNSVDLVIIDPPYQIATTGGKKLHYEKNIKNFPDLFEICNGFDLSILDDICRVEKKVNAYVWCSNKQVRPLLNYFYNKGCNTDIICWHKTNAIPFCGNKFIDDSEYCIFARDTGVKLFGSHLTKHKYYISPSNVADKKIYHHPTIKPLNIIENFVINSSVAGGVVLDCFAGSGTTCVAAKKLGRHYIGMEIDPTYYETACKRLGDTPAEITSQPMNEEVKRNEEQLSLF